ncbi:cache domain-containing protein [Caldimonas sp. KR1-144]|uniref:cache domain-containing protein n=1 Tax=Caldimonas sp. KR1-144 TaxID=3400911 RepID=UPI003C0FA949
MRLRLKLILLAVLPLLLSLALIAFAVRQQEAELARRQQELVKTVYMNAVESELRHYVALALSTITPLYNTGRDDEAIRREVMKQLAMLDYGSDGYFFLYDYDGTNLMHPRQPELVGQNLLDHVDSTGQRPIKVMIDRAKEGGGTVYYTWNKPSQRKVAAKIAYVTGLDRWHWMVGTGIYVDDVEAVLDQLDREMVGNLNTTMAWIVATALFAISVIVAAALLIGLGERRAADAKLTLLTRKIVSSQEEERAYVSRELHDSTSQTLVSVKLLTESALDRMPVADGGARAPLQRALQRLNEALLEVRGMSHRLRPAMLDQLGLRAALRNLGEEMCGHGGQRFELHGGEDLADPPEAIKTVLFRVTQEALTNIRKHAAATRVTIELDGDRRGLRLVIEDNGRGFDAQAMAEHPGRGIGLSNMRERIATIGGSFEIESQPGRTRVRAEIPAEALRRFAAPVAASGGLAA